MKIKKTLTTKILSFIFNLILLGGFLAILYPYARDIFNEEMDRQFENSVAELKSSVKNYTVQHNEALPKVNEQVTYSLKYMIDKKYIDTLINPLNRKLCDTENSMVIITSEIKDVYDYKTVLLCGDYYTEDLEKPSIVLFTSNEDIEEGLIVDEVTVNILVTDNVYVKRVLFAEGDKDVSFFENSSAEDSMKHIFITKNGTYSFFANDLNGNSEILKLEINNIKEIDVIETEEENDDTNELLPTEEENDDTNELLPTEEGSAAGTYPADGENSGLSDTPDDTVTNQNLELE